jgi:ATP-binding cassette, subfamily B, bacterial
LKPSKNSSKKKNNRPSGKRRRVPFIRQVEMADCGVACLAMIIADNRKKASLEEIKERIPIGAEGTDAFSLLQAAAFYGLQGRGVETNTATLRKLPLPVILHWAKKHFVVLVGWSRGKAEIFDPGAGRLKLAIKEFEEHFSGTALLFDGKRLSTQKDRGKTMEHKPKESKRKKKAGAKTRT